MPLIDFFLHIDDQLQQVIEAYGGWTYAILFVIIFCETGLVVTPILPGDSLLFAAGAFAGAGSLDVTVLLVLLSVAAVLGDAVNYSIGHYLGPKALSGKSRFLKKEYLDRTHRFYERYGGKTIVLARFVPIVRTFAPFLAGVGRMNYWQFARYNILGGLLWVGVCVMGGYLFGNLAVVRENFELVILMIVFLSVLPAVVEYILERRRRRAETRNPA
jgi:membrane-associated protein